MATLDGTLEISLVNGYTPNEGDTFEIMTFASPSGTFTFEQGLDIGNGTHFEVDYGPLAWSCSLWPTEPPSHTN